MIMATATTTAGMACGMNAIESSMIRPGTRCRTITQASRKARIMVPLATQNDTQSELPAARSTRVLENSCLVIGERQLAEHLQRRHPVIRQQGSQEQDQQRQQHRQEEVEDRRAPARASAFCRARSAAA